MDLFSSVKSVKSVVKKSFVEMNDSDRLRCKDRGVFGSRLPHRAGEFGDPPSSLLFEFFALPYIRIKFSCEDILTTDFTDGHG